MNFKDKVVLVTGAGRGIGEEIAYQLAREGARLLVTDIDMSGAQRVAAAVTAHGAQALALHCDVSNAESIEAARLRARSHFGHVDMLINNAAAQQFGRGDIHSLDLDLYRRSFEINLLGDVRMVHAFLPHMIERQSGCIVNTASSLVIRPNPVVQHLMPYVTSKGAVLAWTYALACAVKPYGIDVSLFCPGLTSTRPDGQTYPQQAGWLDHTPAAIATPTSVGECVTRLLKGLGEGRFAISSETDHAEALVAFAEAGLDPHLFSV